MLKTSKNEIEKNNRLSMITSLYNKRQEGKDMGNVNRKKGTCETCGRKELQVAKNNGVMACGSCQVLQSKINKTPEIVVAEMIRIHGDRYFPPAKDTGTDYQSEIDSLTDRNKRQQSIIEELKEQIKDLSYSIETLQQSNTDLSNQLQEQEARVESREQEIENLENDVSLMPDSTPNPKLEEIAWKLAKMGMTGESSGFNWDDIEVIRNAGIGTV